MKEKCWLQDYKVINNLKLAKYLVNTFKLCSNIEGKV